MDCKDERCFRKMNKKCRHEKIKQIVEKSKTNPLISTLLSKQYAKDFQYPQISETICYESFLKCATKLVDLTNILAESFVKGTEPQDERFLTLVNEQTDIWPNVGQLGLWSGLEAIEKFIGTFHHDPSLKYCINFLHQDVDKVSSTFAYEVLWSIPSKQVPIPPAAKMFFFLRSYRRQHYKNPIEVTYTYENSNLILKPGDIKFKENWLMDTMQAKFDFESVIPCETLI